MGRRMFHDKTLLLAAVPTLRFKPRYLDDRPIEEFRLQRGLRVKWTQ
jgi:hypothetical protein